MSLSTSRPFDTDNNLLRRIADNTSVVASGGVASNVGVTSSVLPTGASTEATLAALSAKVTACNTGAVTVAASALPTGASTEATLAALSAKVTAVNTGAVVISSSALPTGAATEATLAALNTKVTAVNTGAVVISGALPAGTNVIGNVGGRTTLIKDTTAVSTTPAYTPGDAIGAKRTLSNAVTAAGTGILESITILDRANQSAAMEILIFDADPAAATITDNVAFVFSTDDLKLLCRITVSSADYVTLNSKSIAQLKGIGAVLKAASGTTLYAVAVAVGTPTYAATTDLQITFGILQD